MQRINSKKLANKLRNIEINLGIVASLLEIVKDSCSYHDYVNQELLIKLALKKHYDAIETISLMY